MHSLSSLTVLFTLVGAQAALGCEPIVDFTLRSTVCDSGPRVFATYERSADRFTLDEIVDDNFAEEVSAPLQLRAEALSGLQDADRAFVWLRDRGRVELDVQEAHPMDADDVVEIWDERIPISRVQEVVRLERADCDQTLSDEGFRDATPDSGACFGCSASSGLAPAPFALLVLLAVRRRYSIV